MTVLEFIRDGVRQADDVGDLIAKFDWLDALRDEHWRLAKTTPNPQDCITPEHCQGLSCCPRERACSE